MTLERMEYVIMKIKEVSNILMVGQVVSRVEAKKDSESIGKTISILIPKAIEDGKINHSNLNKIQLKSEVDEKKLTQEGDIILKLNQPYDAAYISKDDEGILITSHCLVIRDIKKYIDPKYLLAFINSEMYKEQAMDSASGALIPMLTKKKIEEIDVPMVYEDQQKKIVALFENINKQQAVFDEIIRLEKMKLENILRGGEV